MRSEKVTKEKDIGIGEVTQQLLGWLHRQRDERTSALHTLFQIFDAKATVSRSLTNSNESVLMSNPGETPHF